MFEGLAGIHEGCQGKIYNSSLRRTLGNDFYFKTLL